MDYVISIDQETLESILQNHALWISSDRKLGRRGDLSYADLGRFDLSNRDMRGVKFRRALLREANLSNARLEGADFTGADLTNACLRGADMMLADLTSAVMFCADLSNAKVAGTRGKYFHMYGCRISLHNLILLPDWAEVIDVVKLVDDGAEGEGRA